MKIPRTLVRGVPILVVVLLLVLLLVNPPSGTTPHVQAAPAAAHATATLPRALPPPTAVLEGGSSASCSIGGGSFSAPGPPPFPNDDSIGDVADYLLSVVFWTISVPFIGLASVVSTFFTSIGCAIYSVIETPMSYIADAFAASETTFGTFGTFAPIVAALVWGIAIALITWFALLAFGIVAVETPEDVKEGVEEG